MESRNKFKILLIDDDKTYLDTFEDCLSSYLNRTELVNSDIQIELEVCSAYDYAIKKLNSADAIHYDIILIDFYLDKNKNGLSLYEQITHKSVKSAAAFISIAELKEQNNFPNLFIPKDFLRQECAFDRIVNLIIIRREESRSNLKYLVHNSSLLMHSIESELDKILIHAEQYSFIEKDNVLLNDLTGQISNLSQQVLQSQAYNDKGNFEHSLHLTRYKLNDEVESSFQVFFGFLSNEDRVKFDAAMYSLTASSDFEVTDESRIDDLLDVLSSYDQGVRKRSIWKASQYLLHATDNFEKAIDLLDLCIDREKQLMNFSNVVEIGLMVSQLFYKNGELNASQSFLHDTFIVCKEHGLDQLMTKVLKFAQKDAYVSGEALNYVSAT